MRFVVVVVASLLAAAPVFAQEDGPAVREQRKFGLTLEAGWNGLSGIGLNATYHVTPMFSIDGGAGLSGVGFKLGARGRVNFGNGNWVPFLAVGYVYGTGTLGEVVDLSETNDNGPLRFRLTPTSFIQGVGGLEYVADGGFTFGVNAGYAYQLGGDLSNVEYVEGTPSPLAEASMNLAYGGGLVLALNLGYTF